MNVEVMFVMIQSHDEGHPSPFLVVQATGLGIQGPNGAMCRYMGLSMIIILYLGPVEAMSHVVESFMWPRGLSCHYVLYKGCLSAK